MSDTNNRLDEQSIMTGHWVAQVWWLHYVLRISGQIVIFALL